MVKHIIIVGFGNLGQAIEPLLKKAFPGYPVIAFDRESDPQRLRVAQEMGVQLHHQEITQHNYQRVLAPLLTEGSYLLNIAVEVSTPVQEVAAQEATCAAVSARAAVSKWSIPRATSVIRG